MLIAIFPVAGEVLPELVGSANWRRSPMVPGIPLLLPTTFDDPRVRAVFSTRMGGVSEAPFDALNLSAREDDRGAVAENLLRFCRAAEFRRCPPAVQRQVHGTTVSWVGGDDGPGAGELRERDGDGLVTRQPGQALAVQVADCVPVLLWDPAGEVVAAVHAGWRGTAAAIVRVALESMIRRVGTDPRQVRVALGPAIGGCCYRVGPEVVEALERVAPAEVVLTDEGERRVDLRAVNRWLLQAAGVAAGSIEDVGGCTCCDPTLFSYRRDGPRTGRLMGAIELR
jgi:polyphenol oxidase